MMRFCILFISLFIVFASAAQSTADAAVQLSVTLQTSPAQITLHWLPAVNSSQYQVYRKLKNSLSWGTALATLPNTATQYVDTVTAGINYEYWVKRTGSNYTGHGYISSGIEVPAIEHRGKLVLLADSTVVPALAAKIARLVKDIEGDGWEVIRHDVDRGGSVAHVKSLIVSDYNNDPLNVKAVFLFGHIPVPYSGNMNPDGHGDHQGAWPADVYYGDMNGTWTDLAGPGSSTNSPARTQNHPADGKFDQSIVPGYVELQVGRVDLYNLPDFTSTETVLLEKYLDKDHEYRKKIHVPKRRALVDDNFGYFSGEAFASSAFKNFSPLVGPSNIKAGDYITTLDTASFLWSYGCGGGWYQGAGGIGNTAGIAAADLKTTFTMLFGSYFGDWDVTNSFLRAPLASGRVLTNSWSGRPVHQYHHMAMGENIGYSFISTQNNAGNNYWGSIYGITGTWIHNALMGDPTLRNDVVAPVPDVVAQKAGYDAHISWSPSPEQGVVGYAVFRKHDSLPSFVRLNTTPVTGTTFTETCLMAKGTYEYMVRAIKLEQGVSGSYYNLSEGISDTAYNSVSPYVAMNVSLTVTGNTVVIQNNTALADSYVWDLGNGDSSTVKSPTVTYAFNGDFVISFTASNACVDSTIAFQVNVTGVGVSDHPADRFSIRPNPSDGRLTIEGNISGSIYVTDLTGRLVHSTNPFEDEKELDLSHLSPGTYFIYRGQTRSATKLIIVR